MVDPITGTIATATAILKFAEGANKAFNTLMKARDDVKALTTSSLSSGAGQFLENKHKVDTYVKDTKAAGLKVNLKVLESQIHLKRKYQELDRFFNYECEHWVYPMWKDMVKNAQMDDQPTTKENVATVKKARKDDDIVNMIKVMIGLIIAIMTTVISLGEQLKEALKNL